MIKAQFSFVQHHAACQSPCSTGRLHENKTRWGVMFIDLGRGAELRSTLREAQQPLEIAPETTASGNS